MHDRASTNKGSLARQLANGGVPVQCEYESIDSTAAGVHGRISFFVGPILVAEIGLHAPVVIDDLGSATPHLARSTVEQYQSVFVSYSHKDAEIVDQLERAYRVLGLEYLRDVRSLRSGEKWNESLLKMIDRADIFQLLWSKASKRSRAVTAEWQYALVKQRPSFVRPVYWERPMPKPPDQLKHLHFAYLELSRRLIR